MVDFEELGSNRFFRMFLGVVDGGTMIVHSEAEAGARLKYCYIGCHIGRTESCRYIAGVTVGVLSYLE